jgi:hypothetical protein
MDTEHIALTEPVRRLEVFTGAGRGGHGVKTRPGLSLRSRPAETRSVPWLDAMDYHRSSCLAGDVNCEIPRLNVLRLTGCSSCRQL